MQCACVMLRIAPRGESSIGMTVMPGTIVTGSGVSFGKA
jgi:hypothetical protein